MEALKSIPQAFFDVIARVTPGIVGVLLLSLFLPGVSWRLLLEFLSGNRLSEGNSLGFSVFALVVLGYIFGHLVAPLGKQLARIPLREKKKDEEWSKYDFLRVNAPEICVLPVRIRAEYTMHFSLSAVFLIVTFCVPWRIEELGALNTFALLSLFLSLSLLSLVRGDDVRGIFWVSVTNLFAEVSKKGQNQSLPHHVAAGPAISNEASTTPQSSSLEETAAPSKPRQEVG